MAIIVQPYGGSWQRFGGTATLSPAKVASLVERGIWGIAELAEHGLIEAVPFAAPEGETIIGAERFEAHAGAVHQVYDTEPLPPPEARRIGKSAILDRITEAQLEMVLQILTPMQMERWRSPDAPTVRVDDPEVLAMLMAIGADPEVVLAEEDAS